MGRMLMGPDGCGFNFDIILGERACVVLLCAVVSGCRSPIVDLCRTGKQFLATSPGAVLSVF